MRDKVASIMLAEKTRRWTWTILSAWMLFNLCLTFILAPLLIPICVNSAICFVATVIAAIYWAKWMTTY